ncbi:hypothetical protein [Aestuariicoccus sp. MJ-SS9]|nr:hypothetical protein [Aestuariicoccus sp. MJ-SS9]MDU8909678.1 hypothetical protein [Aestuariicoccus sp. MJ-SS9]
MTTNSRFIKSVLKTAQDTQVQMPWARGSRRRAFVAKRAAPLLKQRSA